MPIWANPTSSSKIIKTFGVPSFGFGASGHHSFDSSYDLPIFPLNSCPYFLNESSVDSFASMRTVFHMPIARPIASAMSANATEWSTRLIRCVDVCFGFMSFPPYYWFRLSFHRYYLSFHYFVFNQRRTVRFRGPRI